MKELSPTKTNWRHPQRPRSEDGNYLNVRFLYSEGGTRKRFLNRSAKLLLELNPRDDLC